MIVIRNTAHHVGKYSKLMKPKSLDKKKQIIIDDLAAHNFSIHRKLI